MKWILFLVGMSLYLSGKDSSPNPTACTQVCVCVWERDRERETCVIPEGFEAESFPLKYNPTTSECKIHSIEVDLHYF